MTDPNQPTADLPVPTKDEVLFVALGGLGEIGMNLALYGHAGKWLAVDMGVTFGDEDTPGVDVIVPDISALEALGDDLVGILITHAHEDHIGAVPYLAGRFKCPVYASPFAAAFLRKKLEDDGGAGAKRKVKIIEVNSPGAKKIAPFNIQMVPMPHSIPEANLVAIRTKAGMVVHSGDWKMDDGPVIGPKPDADALAKLGEEGVAALVCDSTNVLREGWTGSESSLTQPIEDLIKSRKNRVIFACFSSNVARLYTVAKAAKAAGRDIGLVGRSLWRMHGVAGGLGYLDGLPEFLQENDIGYLPRNKMVAICTGSQGEPRAALHRIADGQHRHLTLEKGDTVCFSSRDIPGNEKAIGRLQNRLIEAGVEVITAGMEDIHVSGHPAQDEIRRLYELLKPERLLPAHGEGRHLIAHAAFAKDCGVPESMVAFNGHVVRLAGADFTKIGDVKVGRVGLDGKTPVSLNGDALRERRRMRIEGMAHITVVLDDRGRLAADSMVTLSGLDAADDDDVLDVIEESIDDAITAMKPGDRKKDDPVHEAARTALRRVLRRETGKRPQVSVHVVRL